MAGNDIVLSVVRARPYQPFLLRLLPGLAGLIAVVAWCIGTLLDLRVDHRQGGFSLHRIEVLSETHVAIGLSLLPIAFLFGC